MGVTVYWEGAGTQGWARWPALGLATRIRFYTQIEAQRTFELQPHFILRARNVGTGPAIAELRAVVRMAGETGRC